MNEYSKNNTPEFSDKGYLKFINSTTDWIASRANNIQSSSLYFLNKNEFQYGVMEGKILYREFMDFLSYTLPQLNESIEMAMGLLNDENSDKNPMPTMILMLHVQLKNNAKSHNAIQELFLELNNIDKLIGGKTIVYKSILYGIGKFQSPQGLTSNIQKMFYLLYLIRQENPEFLSVDLLRKRVSSQN